MAVTQECVPSALPVMRSEIVVRFPNVFVGLTYLLISCARPRAPRSDAARPLPRLTNAVEEANCKGRDAVAPKVGEELQLRSI
jgi:hypothetical protein